MLRFLMVPILATIVCSLTGCAEGESESETLAAMQRNLFTNQKIFARPILPTEEKETSGPLAYCFYAATNLNNTALKHTAPLNPTPISESHFQISWLAETKNSNFREGNRKALWAAADLLAIIGIAKRVSKARLLVLTAQPNWKHLRQYVNLGEPGFFHRIPAENGMRLDAALSAVSVARKVDPMIAAASLIPGVDAVKNAMEAWSAWTKSVDGQKAKSDWNRVLDQAVHLKTNKDSDNSFLIRVIQQAYRNQTNDRNIFSLLSIDGICKDKL